MPSLCGRTCVSRASAIKAHGPAGSGSERDVPVVKRTPRRHAFHDRVSEPPLPHRDRMRLLTTPSPTTKLGVAEAQPQKCASPGCVAAQRN